MSDKRMLILAEEVVRKINQNRGDLSQGEFIDFLIESHFNPPSQAGAAVEKQEVENVKKLMGELKDKLEGIEKKSATKDEVQAFQEDTRKLLKSFLDFFVGYGLELGNHSLSGDLKELSSSLEKLEQEGEEGGQVKIKWKKQQ
jgi:hypothetical protein